ncbi:hypothetical protein LUZ60_008108 [Juncus effusus]|nr:hypothetical protein LUZ60_008108 [Juncus effusus]
MDSNLQRLLEEIRTGTEPLREDILVQMPSLISYLRHGDARILKQSIACGSVLIARVLKQISFQINSTGKIDRWLEVMWNWMVQFKDSVPAILSETASVGTKILVLKFLEACALLFTPHDTDSTEKEQGFNITQLSGGFYPRILDPAILESDGLKALNILIDILRSSYSHRGALTVTAINCLAIIAKKRPIHYERILSELLGFDPNIESAKGAHISSIKYNLRFAFLGFLKSSHPSMIESKDRLTRALRTLSPGESTEQIIRQIEKRATRDNLRLTKDDQSQSRSTDDLPAKKRAPPPSLSLLSSSPPSKRARASDNSSSEKDQNNNLSPAGKMIAVIGALIAEGERGVGPLELLISNIHSDLMADIVIETMGKFTRDKLGESNINGNYQHQQVNLSDPRKMDNQINPSDGGEAKRDPRRDPRRLDPRRPINPSPIQSQSIIDPPLPPPPPLPILPKTLNPKSESISIESPKLDKITELKSEELDLTDVPLPPPPPLTFVDRHVAESPPSDQNSEEDKNNNRDEESEDVGATSGEVPVFPVCLEMSEKEERERRERAVQRIIDGLERGERGGERGSEARLQLISRMVSQIDTDDEMLEQVRKHVSLDYNRHQGHELAINVLYHLETAIISESSHSDSNRYEKFLISLARALIENLPSTDKSFGRLLNEAPSLPDSIFHLLEELCMNSSSENININKERERETDGGDRITQGLGTVWSLILGRPAARLACLDIALKCAVHLQDEVRSKAIRLVANKLYLLSYASEKIEEFAKDKFFSIVREQTLETESRQESQETSVTSSQNSEQRPSLSQSQTQISLFFALCSKKPSLLRLVFDVYGNAPKAAKQAIHRHLPVLLRNLGSCAELLDIIYNLPEGSENLIILVLQVLTDESTPSADLITAVKHLYFTKLKDPVILIPMLSSLSKEEVLPIFPKLVDLPLEKFQAALARILQGSAHTGPALTPAEVLIAIHDINPDKDGVVLKKVMDSCTACFEQRTVFTQQVLAKALNQMVERVPLPILFMRTVIQTIGAFPALVDFVMGLLSKLVKKQIWRTPKLYAGFLKCVYQTQPHSFPVLLELPAPQLENVLTKHPNIKAPLASHVINKNLHTSLPRQTLIVLGLITEPQQPAAQRPFDSNASIQGTTLS